MNFATLFFVFLAGLVCGLALRPQVDRQRKLRSLYRSLALRQQGNAPSAAEGAPAQGFAMPRDYYLSENRERGTLSEGFGLHRDLHRDTSRTESAPTGGRSEPADVSLPRDYYERETPEDEGLLSEGYGLRRKSPPADAA